jgi:hypothetical protein
VRGAVVLRQRKVVEVLPVARALGDVEGVSVAGLVLGGRRGERAVQLVALLDLESI